MGIAVRKIPGDGPIKTPLLANITCNEGAVPIAGRTGAVTAGTPIKFYWNECKFMKISNLKSPRKLIRFVGIRAASRLVV